MVLYFVMILIHDIPSVDATVEVDMVEFVVVVSAIAENRVIIGSTSFVGTS